VVNNLNSGPAEVLMVATRNNGEETAATRTVGALGQLVESTADLFPELGEGPGYVVIVVSDVPVNAAFVVTATGSASGDSPAQTDAVSLDANSPTLLFNFLPITADGGSSAPVVVNLGIEDATVTFHAYQNGALAASSDPVVVPVGRPFADITSNLFPGIQGDIYVVAESNQPLTGTAFIFNALREPSMANALPIGALPGGE
jgi:hypothetical protein